MYACVCVPCDAIVNTVSNVSQVKKVKAKKQQENNLVRGNKINSQCNAELSTCPASCARCVFHARDQVVAAVSPASTQQDFEPNQSGEKHRQNSCDVIYEFACDKNSEMGNISRNFGVRHVRLHEDFIDLLNNDMCLQLDNQLNNEEKVGLWGSIPCTVWSMWQEMAVHRLGAKYAAKLHTRRLKSKIMLKHFIRSAEIVINKGGLIAFEWPRHCKGWLLKELQGFITKHNLIEALCDGCAFNMKNEAGDHILKPWRVITNSERLARNLSAFRRSHEKGFKHAPVEGSTTAKTAFYPQSM